MAYSLLLLRMAAVLALATYQGHLAPAPTSSCWVACSQATINQAAKQSKKERKEIQAVLRNGVSNSSAQTRW